MVSQRIPNQNITGNTVMLIDDVRTVADSIAPLLTQENLEIVSCVHHTDNLYAHLRVCNPAIIIINTDLLKHEIIEFIATVNSNKPTPVLLFITTIDQEQINTLIQNGISSITVGRDNIRCFRPIIDIALARFHLTQTRH